MTPGYLPQWQRDMLRPPKHPDVPWFPSLLKSNLQKAIRRTEPAVAARTMKSLLAVDASAALRRFAVIILEDALLHPAYPDLLALLRIAGRKDAALDEGQRTAVLQLVVEVAGLQVRDIGIEYPSHAEAPNPAPTADVTGLPPAEAALVTALFVRARMGGLAGDVAMLREFGHLWAQRFHTGEWTAAALANVYRLKAEYGDLPLTWAGTAWATEGDILLPTVDQHCSGVVYAMLKRPELAALVCDEYPEVRPQDVVGEVIWAERGGLNYKHLLRCGRPQDKWRDLPHYVERWGHEGREKFQRIHAALEPHLDAFAQGWIGKQRERA